MDDKFEKIMSDSHAAAKGYKCPSCGAPMQYSPESKTLVCEHCGTQSAIEFDDAVVERSFKEIFENRQWSDGVKVIRCKNCGAKQVLDKNEIAATCPFCGSPAVLEIDELAGIKPDTAIPFSVGKKSATERCLKWIKSKFFAPTKFKKEVEVKNLNGCYCPVWTFDCDTVVHYNGTLGKHYTETYVIDGKTYTRTKVRYFDVSGSINKVYDDIYVKGSDVVNEKYLQKIQPYKMSDYVRYDDRMLAGFSANHYTVDPMDAWEQAESRIKRQMRGEILSRYDADEVVSLNIVLQHKSRSFKYLMLPVYISAVTYKNKLYNQYVNGSNGKVAGKVPKSPAKISLVSLLGVAAVGLLIFLISLI